MKETGTGGRKEVDRTRRQNATDLSRTETIAVTPTLYVGPPTAAYIWLDMIPVETVGDAFTVIRCGLKALLPPGSWDLAANVLRYLGLPEDLIAFRLSMSKDLPEGYDPSTDRSLIPYEDRERRDDRVPGGS